MAQMPPTLEDVSHMIPDSCDFHAQPVFQGTLIRTFFENLNFSTRIEAPPRSSNIAENISSFFLNLKMPNRYHESVYKHQKAGVSFANCYPPKFSSDIRLFIAKYRICILYIESTPIKDIRKELEVFSINVGNYGYHFRDPILTLLATLLRGQVRQHYGPIGTQAIIESTLGFISGCIVEGLYSNELYSSGLDASAAASGFPRWHRRRTGNSGSFAHMLFPQRYSPESSFLRSYLPAIVYLVDFIDMTNDILSFYKDVVVGAKTNMCIVNMARISGVNPVSVLEETSESCVSAHRTLRKVLSCNIPYSSMLEAFDGFVTGYLWWHCIQTEYRLSGIGVTIPGPGASTQLGIGLSRLEISS